MYKDNKPVPTQSSELLPAADFLTLTFNTQKNGVNGERIGHRRSTSATLCPVLAVGFGWPTSIYTWQSQTNHCAPTIIMQTRPTAILHPKTSHKYSVHQPYITHVSVLTQLLWSAALYILAVWQPYFMLLVQHCNRYALA